MAVSILHPSFKSLHVELPRQTTPTFFRQPEETRHRWALKRKSFSVTAETNFSMIDGETAENCFP